MIIKDDEALNLWTNGAYATLLVHIQPIILNLVYRMSYNVIERSTIYTIEDLTQEVNLKLVYSIPRYDPTKGQVMKYLIGVIIRKIWDLNIKIMAERRDAFVEFNHKEHDYSHNPIGTMEARHLLSSFNAYLVSASYADKVSSKHKVLASRIATNIGQEGYTPAKGLSCDLAEALGEDYRTVQRVLENAIRLFCKGGD